MATKRVKSVAEYKLVSANKKNCMLNEGVRLSDASSISNFILDEIYGKDIDVLESAYVLFFNNGMYLKGYMKISSGGVASTMIDPKIVFCGALKALATAIIIVHNHPSGNSTPSSEDKRVTSQLKQGGELLEINLLDHIIVTPQKGTYYSFAEWGNI